MSQFQNEHTTFGVMRGSLALVNTPTFLGVVMRGAFGGFRDDNFWPGVSSYTRAFCTLVSDGDRGIFTSSAPNGSAQRNTPAIASATYNQLTVKGHQTVES